jgi:hypothetical protein
VAASGWPSEAVGDRHAPSWVGFGGLFSEQMYNDLGLARALRCQDLIGRCQKSIDDGDQHWIQESHMRMKTPMQAFVENYQA